MFDVYIVDILSQLKTVMYKIILLHLYYVMIALPFIAMVNSDDEIQFITM